MTPSLPTKEKTATSATTYCMQTPYHTTFIILKWRESNQTALSHPSLFQIRSNRPLDPNSCINIVVTAPLPSPQHLTQCQRRHNTAGPSKSSSSMSQVTLQVKPYKLKATTESKITRDDFITWKDNLQSFLRQKQNGLHSCLVAKMQNGLG